jgi:hypothetical protein
MTSSPEQRRIVEEIARLLQNKYSREGLAQFFRGRYGIDVTPEDIQHKAAYVEAILLEQPEDRIKELARYLGVGVASGSTSPGSPPTGAADANSSPSVEKRENPQTWVGLTYWLVSDRRRLVAGIVCAILLGGLLVGGGRLLGYDVFASVFPRLARVKTTGGGEPVKLACIDTARARKEPYVVLSATELVELQDLPIDSTRQARHAKVRMIYTLFMLRDLSRDNDAVFHESFTSDYGALIRRWFGTERETSDIDGSSYDVLFSAKTGETRTLITGSTYIVPLPLSPNRTAFSQNTSLGANEDTWGYPNTTDGDVICELTIVLWSPTLKLIPVGQAAKRQTGRTVRGADVVVNESPRDTAISSRSLSARWLNVMPGEEVGIHFAW